MNDKLGVVFEKSHKLQFHKRIEDVNNTIGYVFAKIIDTECNCI